MEFRILGPLEITTGDGPVELRSAKVRALLALLLTHANEVVSADRLIDDLWEGVPPRSASATLQTYVSQVRKQLGAAVVESAPGGYRVSLAGHRLDAAEFETALDDASAGDDVGPALTADRLREALDLWRGPALADFAGASWATAEAARLDSLRLVAIEARIDVRLALGEHSRLVPELETLVVTYPLRERLWGQLMVALYRCGRQADALRAYGRLRTHLGEELGIEPSAELVRLEQAILLQETELDWRPPAPVAVTAVETPAGLPTGVVTFLLTDVVGSTQAWDEHPAAMTDALAIHDALIAGAIKAHHGRLLKQRGEGDSTFAVFTRATDALAAALDAQRSLTDQAWPAEVELSVRMAIHTGEAIERDGDYYGTTVNRAARLRGLADGGQILVSQSTVELCVDHLPADTALVELGKRSLRGMRRLEAVYIVAAADASPRPGAARDAGVDNDVNVPVPGPLERPHTEPFVGRTAELAVLEKAWQAARDGERCAALLAGEPGIGKTRLAAELAQHVRADDGMVLYGRCDEDLGVAFQPFTEALRQYVACSTPRTLHAAAGDGLSELSRLLPELQTLIPGLPPARVSDPETERYELFEGIISVFANLSRTAPMLLVVDDLHWATKPTLLLLRHLLRAPTRMSLLILGTYRSTEASGSLLGEMLPDLRSPGGVEPITLRGFSSDEVGEYLSSTGTNDEPAALAHSLQRSTNGNPLFVREMVRSFAERGGASDDVNDRETKESLPQSVRDVIERRLSRLTPSARQTLATAAVIGHSLRVDLLERTTRGDTDSGPVLDTIDEALAAGILTEPSPETDTLEFTHALIRHTIYSNLTAARRARLHQHVAQTLEALGDIVADDDRVPALAYHWAHAAQLGHVDDAAEYAIRAGRQALTQLAFEDAVAYLERGLRTLDASGGRDHDWGPRLWFAIGEARWMMGDLIGTKAAARRAIDGATATRDSDLVVRATFLHCESDFGSLDRSNDELLMNALELLDKDRTDLHAQVLANLSYRQSSRGDTEAARPEAERALKMARESGDLVAQAMALNACIASLYGSPLVIERLAFAHELLRIGKELSNDTLYLVARFEEQHARAELGDPEDFDRFIDEVPGQQLLLQFFDPELRHVDMRTGERFQAANQTFLAMLRGRWDDAAAYGERVRQGFRSPSLFNLYSAQLFHRRREQGQCAELIRGVQRTAEWPWPIFGAAYALALADAGQIDDCRTQLERTAPSAYAGLPRGIMWQGMLAYLSEVCSVLREHDRARALHQLLEPYSGHLVIVANMVACLGAVDRYLGMLEIVVGRYDDAERHFRSALKLEERIESPPLIARTQYWYAEMLLLRRGPGDRERASELLTSCSRSASDLGMTLLAEQATAKLSAAS